MSAFANNPWVKKDKEAASGAQDNGLKPLVKAPRKITTNPFGNQAQSEVQENTIKQPVQAPKKIVTNPFGNQAPKEEPQAFKPTPKVL